MTAILVACTSAFVDFLTVSLTDWKFKTVLNLMSEGNHGGAFFVFHLICLLFAILVGSLCYYEPNAIGSGIPEIKAFLNGINISNAITFSVFFVKTIGMSISLATGLPVGKCGPMIHVGSIIGAYLSQGLSFKFLGYDTSWIIFQDLRNDYTKRDFVTYGCAAGVVSTFYAPIGGILFTLEEGSSYWSTITTFRAFVCALITQLSLSIIFPAKRASTASFFTFGEFNNYDDRSNYFFYELPLFFIIGLIGGVLGGYFNEYNIQVTSYRIKNINSVKMNRVLDVCCITLVWAFISYILSICWQVCTPIPYNSYEDDLTAQEEDLLSKLVHFQCHHGHYNQLSTLFFSSNNLALRQLYHFKEFGGEGLNSLTSGPLILFFVFYYVMTIISASTFAPTGLFAPTILGGAVLGRLFGHWLNILFPGSVTDAGTYALIGSAALFGGMSRMTIAGCVIFMESCGNASYLLPIMLSFTGSRYAGGFISEAMFEKILTFRNLPFLKDNLSSDIGLLNYYSISMIMNKNPICINEVEKVKRIMEILLTTTHNGFPVVNNEGKYKGFILRKTLVLLLKMKAYSTPIDDNTSLSIPPTVPNTTEQQNSAFPLPSYNSSTNQSGGQLLQPAATIFYDTIEKYYPNYPDVSSIRLSDRELKFWLDVRTHMDASPIYINDLTSIGRAYEIFRNLGMRHLVVIDSCDSTVKGILTRHELNQTYLRKVWANEKLSDNNDLIIEQLPPAIGYENPTSTSSDRHRSQSHYSTSSIETIDSDVDIELVINNLVVTDSPKLPLRKKFVENNEYQDVSKDEK